VFHSDPVFQTLVCLVFLYFSLSFIFIFSSNLFFLLFPLSAQSKVLVQLLYTFCLFSFAPNSDHRLSQKKKIYIDSMIQTFEHSFENNSTFFKSPSLESWRKHLNIALVTIHIYRKIIFYLTENIDYSFKIS
jgi:hypothetical protein